MRGVPRDDDGGGDQVAPSPSWRRRVACVALESQRTEGDGTRVGLTSDGAPGLSLPRLDAFLLEVAACDVVAVQPLDECVEDDEDVGDEEAET